MKVAGYCAGSRGPSGRRAGRKGRGARSFSVPVNQSRCAGPACDRRASVRHPATGEPLCTGHYQQARLHPERPLRPLQPRRRQGDPFTCDRCGRSDRTHYAKGRCELCYMYDLNRRLRRQGDHR